MTLPWELDKRCDTPLWRVKPSLYLPDLIFSDFTDGVIFLVPGYWNLMYLSFHFRYKRGVGGWEGRDRGKGRGRRLETQKLTRNTKTDQSQSKPNWC